MENTHLNKIINGVVMFLCCCLSAHDSLQLQDQKKLGINVITCNDQGKITMINEKEDFSDCSRYVGNELKERMAYLSKEQLKKNLINFAPRTRKKYQESLYAHKAQELLNTLDNNDRSELALAMGQEGVQFIKYLEDKITAHTKEQAGKGEGTWLAPTLMILGAFFGIPIA